MTQEAEREYAEIRERIRQSEDRLDKFEAYSVANFKRANERMDRAEKRAEQFEKRQKKRWEAAEKRWEAADQRMDKFEKQILVTKKLVDAGMKMLVRLGARMDSLAKTQQAYMRSLGNGHNRGNGRNGTKR